jgi:mannose-1-phosphate guanylyltransferase
VKALLLIGGLATRLLPLSRHIAKSLLPVCDREVLHYQISQIARAGIGEIVLAAGHHIDQLQEYVSGYAGLSFEISHEAMPMGTAGAIAQARDLLDDDPLLILNADILCEVDLAKMLHSHLLGKRPATILGHKVADPGRFGLLSTQGSDIVGFTEKPEGGRAGGPEYINAGAYVLDRTVIDNIPADRPVSIERETFPQLITGSGPLNLFPHEGLWIDVGTFDSYFAANFAMLARRYSQGGDALWGERDDVAIFKDLVYIHRSARLTGPVDLYHRVIAMRDVRIAGGSRLENCILMPGSSIGERCDVSSSIIGPGVRVDAGASVTNQVLVAGEEPAAFFPEAREAL